MNEVTKEITDKYFNQKVKDEVSIETVILEDMEVKMYRDVSGYSYGSYTDARIIEYKIPSDSINHNICYIHVEKLLRKIVSEGKRVSPSFHTEINDSVSQVENINIGIHNGFIKIESIPSQLKTSRWMKKSKKHNTNEKRLSIENEILLATTISDNDIPMETGVFQNPSKDERSITYSIFIPAIDDYIYFKVSSSGNIDDEFKNIVESVGGNPSYIPNSEFCIVPSWIPVKLLATDTTGLWGITTEESVRLKYGTLIEKIKMSLGF